MTYDPGTNIVTLVAGRFYRVLGEDVYVTRDYPRARIDYYKEAFHCGPGRYPLESFQRILNHMKMYKAKDTRKITDCLTTTWEGVKQDFKADLARLSYGDVLKDYYLKPMREWLNYLPGTLSPSPKEKQVTQYQALLPVDLERHLYSGSTLYDLENDVFRKITSVVRTDRKNGFTTTITFLGGTKRIFKDGDSLRGFANHYRWVTLRNMPDDDPCLRYDIPTRSWVESQIAAAKGPDTVHHYSRARDKSGDTGITHIGWESVNKLIDAKVKDALQSKVLVAESHDGKKRWFR